MPDNKTDRPDHAVCVGCQEMAAQMEVTMDGAAPSACAYETLGRFPVAVFLNHDVEHHAILIHGAPQIVRHILDPDEPLVQVPFATRLWPSVAQAVGKALTEFLAPPPHRS